MTPTRYFASRDWSVHRTDLARDSNRVVLPRNLKCPLPPDTEKKQTLWFRHGADGGSGDDEVMVIAVDKTSAPRQNAGSPVKCVHRLPYEEVPP